MKPWFALRFVLEACVGHYATAPGVDIPWLSPTELLDSFSLPFPLKLTYNFLHLKLIHETCRVIGCQGILERYEF